MSYKITDLIAETTPASGDLIPIVDVSDAAQSAGGSTNKMTYANFVGGILSEQGITSSVAELNILDGVTSTATEINLLSGITTLSGSNTGDEVAASLTVSGVIEIATATEITTGTDNVRAASPLALGGLDTKTSTYTNKRITKRVTTITSNATPTVNTDNCDMVSITALATNITSMTTNLSGTPTNGQTLLYRILDNGTGRTITWGASFEAKGATPATSTTASKLLYVIFIYDTVAAKWGCVTSQEEA